MSDEENKTEESEFDESKIKCFQLMSGEKIITYVSDWNDQCYICERPFTIVINKESGTYFLMQYLPYADSFKKHLIGLNGVISISSPSKNGIQNYYKAVSAEVEYELTSEMSKSMESIDEFLKEFESSDFDPRDESTDNIVSLKDWKIDDETPKNQIIVFLF